jgi:hypothetical protein
MSEAFQNLPLALAAYGTHYLHASRLSSKSQVEMIQQGVLHASCLVEEEGQRCQLS